MKHLKLSSMSILIASALLLSAAKGAHGESRNPRSDQHKRPAAEESKNTQERKQEPTVPFSLFQANQSALDDALHTIRAQEEAGTKRNRPQKDKWDKAAVVADYLLFVVGCLYTFFAWGQWAAIDAQAQTAQKTLNVIQRQVEIAEESTAAAKASAEASKQSANTANLALHIDRPFLVPDKFTFADAPLSHVAQLFKSDTVKSYVIDHKLISPATVPVTFRLRNYGKGPAVMRKVIGRIAVASSVSEIPIDDFSECEEWPVSRSVFGIGDEESISSPILAMIGIHNPKAGSLTVEEQCAIINSQAILIVYGQIAYTDLFDASFFVDFCWIYSSFAFLGLASGAAIPSDKERNRHH
jgi:hypothetical protein